MWTEFKSDFIRLLCHARAFLREHRRAVLIYLLVGGGLTALVGQWDFTVRDYYAPLQTPEFRKITNTIRRTGDGWDSLMYFAALYALGIWRKRRDWRVYAAAALLGAILAGLTVNAIRISTGRPRPFTGRTEWIGPTLLQYNSQSFPSGHTGTSLGMSSTLVQLVPVLGAPALAGSLAVGWASVAKLKHYTSDVAGALVIGLLSGAACASAARRRVRELREEGVLP